MILIIDTSMYREGLVQEMFYQNIDGYSYHILSKGRVYELIGYRKGGYSI